MIVGIDLGTTNSAVATWADDAPRLVPNALGAVLTPSAVSLDDSGEVLVGLAARERQVTHPALTATAFKRYMGSNREIRLGSRTFLPEELSALVLRSLKRDAEAVLGEPVTGAIITVPAYFNDRQRQATRRAGELAGLKVERLINEPTAAALAYGIHRLQEQPRFLVFDLGGGTFDVSLLEIFEDVIEVRASTGDNFLGGEDFNDLLVERFFREHAGELREKRRDANPALYQRMREAAERTRRALTSGAAAKMEVAWRERTHALEITQEQFEQLVEPLLARLREPVIRALRDARLAAESLTEIVLVGGATRMPVVRRTVARMFGRFPSTAVNPDEAVALGAAVQAGMKTRAHSLREVVLTDVCPYSLGVDVAVRLPDGSFRDGVFDPIIERNTVVPASRVKTFATLQDGQAQVEFGVYQGESRLVKDNIELGRVHLPVPRRRAGEIAVQCRFSYDINGLLEVDVVVPETGERRELVIYDGDSHADPQEIAQRRAALAELKVHPRDVESNRALLARAARCYEQSLGDVRTHLSARIGAFEGVLERQDPREIEVAAREFADLLDRLEGETYL